MEHGERLGGSRGREGPRERVEEEGDLPRDDSRDVSKVLLVLFEKQRVRGERLEDSQETRPLLKGRPLSSCAKHATDVDRGVLVEGHGGRFRTRFKSLISSNFCLVRDETSRGRKETGLTVSYNNQKG